MNKTESTQPYIVPGTVPHSPLCSVLSRRVVPPTLGNTDLDSGKVHFDVQLVVTDIPHHCLVECLNVQF